MDVARYPKGVHLGNWKRMNTQGESRPFFTIQAKSLFLLAVASMWLWKSRRANSVCLVRKSKVEMDIRVSFSWHTCPGPPIQLLPSPSAVQQIKECKAALLPQDNHLLGEWSLSVLLEVFCPTEAKPICQDWSLQSSDVANWNHLILNA